ncbi:MAG: RHS repeat-associated core domain-containing protein [Candidatus Firestonebacteria bacterium]
MCGFTQILSKREKKNKNIWETVYFHQDGLGSVRLITDKEGKPIGEYDYSPFGKIIEMDGKETRENNFTFASREYDKESGLYYYRTRYYDPKIGRFTSRDTLKVLDASNQYVYVLNNPLRWTDPEGRDTPDVSKLNNAIFTALNNQNNWPELMPDGSTKTYCNRFVAEVASKRGINDLNSLSANEQYIYVEGSSKWKNVTAEQAKNYAKVGYFVGGFMNKIPNGHSTIVAPGYELSNTGSGLVPMVYDINKEENPLSANWCYQYKNNPPSWYTRRNK